MADTKRKKAGSAPRRRSQAPGAARKARDEPACTDAEAFTKALVASGQAAAPDKDGKLPPGATHKLSKSKRGAVKVVRRRFSIA